MPTSSSADLGSRALYFLPGRSSPVHKQLQGLEPRAYPSHWRLGRRQRRHRSRRTTCAPIFHDASAPPKKIKLGDYAKKRAAGELRADSPNPPPRDDLIERRPLKPQEKVKRPHAHSNGFPSKGSDNEAKGPSRPSPPVSPVSKSHESLLPSEDLPPPLTPLPSRLLAAVAEYREHLKSHSNGNKKSLNTTMPATKAYRRYQKRVERFNTSRSNTGSNLMVTLKFRKRHKQYGDLARSLALRRLNAHCAAQKLGKEAVVRLKRLGEDLIRESRMSEAGKNALLMHLEEYFVIWSLPNLCRVPLLSQESIGRLL